MRTEEGYWTQPKDYISCMWSNAVYDYYTGTYYNFGNMDGDSRKDVTTKLRFNGRDYMISCSKSNEWEHGEWTYDEARDL